MSASQPQLELLQHEIGVGLVVRRADVIRLGREVLEPGSDLGALSCVKPPFRAATAQRRPAGVKPYGG